MKLKTKYFILILSLIGLSLLVFNVYSMRFWANVMTELDISLMLFVVGLLGTSIFSLTKKRKKILSKIIFISYTLSIILSIHLSTIYYNAVQHNKKISEYFELTCEEMLIRFKDDELNNRIQYFDFGFVSRIKEKRMKKKLKSKFRIDYHFLGDILRNNLICYNKLVEKHLLSKYNVSLNEFSKDEIKN